PAVDAEHLRQHVTYLSETLFPRSFDHPGKLRAASRYIQEQFVAAGATVVVQDVIVQDEKFNNVIARFGPATGKLLVIGAHYDSHGDTPGADDNASGVAGLLELARLFAKHPPTQPVELVAYTLEEPPHFRTDDMGSVWHARSVQGKPVEMMIALEMLGYFKDEEGSQSYPVAHMEKIYPTRGNFIGIVGRFSEWAEVRKLKAAMAGSSDLPVVSINAPPALPGVDFSDHRSYWAVDIPAVMVTDTAFFRNPNYHQAGDVAGNLDYVRMAKVVQGVFAFTQR
ncbi:MAG TPA: M28 family peptidase, partial [Rhodocyclaceae bacterium]|nr:M28 family peptidase [Rhodocyclaceae bacterium]